MEPVKLAFVDTETTGLDPRIHSLWEIAIIQAIHTDNILQVESEKRWVFCVDLSFADPMALKVTNYFKRQGTFKNHYDSPVLSAETIARSFDGRHFVANVPDFDSNMIKKFLWENGQTATWHYHLICCENLIAGKYGCPPPWKSDDLSKYWAGVEPPSPEEKHTAMGDAQWAMRIYAKVYNLEVEYLPKEST